MKDCSPMALTVAQAAPSTGFATPFVISTLYSHRPPVSGTFEQPCSSVNLTGLEVSEMSPRSWFAPAAIGSTAVKSCWYCSADTVMLNWASPTMPRPDASCVNLNRPVLSADPVMNEQANGET